MPTPVVGAQLYTVRSHVQTLSGIADALGKIRKIGYTAIQVSGTGPVPPGDLARVVRESGLTVAATHMSWERFLRDLDAVVEEHRQWGCRHLAIGGLPGEYFSEDGLARFAEELAPVSARLAREGMDFSYHNHNHELAHYGGQPWLERMYARVPAEQLKAEIDTYWIQAGGGDPSAWIRRCAGREPLLHLKDMVITASREQRFAEVGAGNLNWQSILSAAEEGGVEYLLVEQDDCYGRDPFESLAISYENLVSMGYQ